MTLPKPPNFGNANWLVGDKNVKVVQKENTVYADTIAIVMDVERDKLIALYSDKLCLIWDMENKNQINIY